MRPITEKLKIEARTGDMTRAKKILFLRCIGLTGCLSSGIMPIVKTNDNNSSKPTILDNAGELRSREARTASFVRHTSPALSRFFMRLHRMVGVL